jgi:hypothetical protein
MSAFLREQIKKRLAELRYKCGLQRLYLRHATGRRWAYGSRSSAEMERDYGSSDKYWDETQAKSKRDAEAGIELADKELADFIAEHRTLMGSDWVGNLHGKLCWSPYSGGRPIDQHYCQKPVGHDGQHGNEKGEWPLDVTNEYEWRRLLEKTASGAVPAHADESRPQTTAGADLKNGGGK